MYLKALSIRGFKSFANTTTLDFVPGINAVVGPNGSGKSNVVDAISWVLGEQGTKSLRAGSMSDVIFSGTSEKSALGRAHVTLTIDNSDDVLPLPLSDIEISRTIFRNGGSEYSINGEPARLADVQQLMASAHVGKSKHSLITQGHIERVLNATALERRELIEEAAGISAYRARAEQTEKKLASMKANLDRLEDLEAELASQLEPLGEQAEAARSAREVQARIRELRLALIAAEAGVIQGERKSAQSRSDELGINLARAQQKAEALNAALKARSQELSDQRTAVENFRTEETRTEHIQALLAKVSAVADERLKAQNTVATDELEHQIAKTKSEVKVYEESSRQSQKGVQELEEVLAQSQEEVDRLVSLIEELETSLDEAESAQNDHRQHLVDLTQELARTKANLDRANDEYQRRQDESQTAAESIKNFDQEQDGVKARLAGLEAELEELKKQEVKAHDEREQALDQFTQAGEKLNQLTVAAERARATSETLKSALPAQSQETTASPLFEYLTITQPYHTAISVALGAWEQANTEGASETGAWKAVSGKVSKRARKQLTLPDQLPDFLIPAHQVVSANGKFEDSLALALNGVFVHESLSESEEKVLEDFLAHYPLMKAISESGTLQTAYGELPASGEASTLELYARAQEAEAELKSAQKQRKEQQRVVALAEEHLTAVRTAEKDAARSTGVLNAKIATVKAELTHLQAKAESAAETLNLLKDRADKAQTQVKDSEKAYREVRQNLEAAQSGKDLKNPADFRVELRQQQKSLEKARTEYAQKSAQVEIARAKSEADLAQLHQVETVLETQQKTLTEAEQHNQAVYLQQEKAQLVKKRAQQLSGAVAQTSQELTGKLAVTTASLAELSQAQSEEQETLENQRQLLQSITQQSAQLTVQLGALTTQWEMLAAKADEELAENLDDILENLDDSEEIDLEATEKELIDQQKILADIGAVNPLALEEYNALTERHTYLAEQIKDLKSTRADLRSIIKELNERINREFTDAFAETAQHFETIFARLFPGGEGSLTLTDPADVLNTGVEIHAKPAGKKVKRISLLSGGERALASLALLTAIFAARPTPFYVLDEVEAALDDRNLGRLLEVFKELAEKSQLIIITHKTRTIEIADTMYGISMKDGVSLVLKQSVEQLRHSLQPSTSS